MDKLEKLCIKWLNDNYNPMEPFIIKEYPDYIFHMKNGQCILQYNKKNGYVYVSYREIWSFFERVFSMSNQQIKDITKIWVEEYYKMGVTSTLQTPYLSVLEVEEHYKMGVTTTSYLIFEDYRTVEEHYKMGVKNITPNNDYVMDLVDKLYKSEITKTNDEMEVTTNRSEVFLLDKKVKEHYENKIQITNDQNKFYFEREVEELYNQYKNG